VELTILNIYWVYAHRDDCRLRLTMPLIVNLPQQSYKIVIAAQGLDQLGESMTSLNLGKKVLVVSTKSCGTTVSV